MNEQAPTLPEMKTPQPSANSVPLQPSEWSQKWAERFNGSKPLIDDPKLWAEAVAERDNDQQTPHPVQMPKPPIPPPLSEMLPPDYHQRIAERFKKALLDGVETP